ncbi:sensor histidine kinase [Bradyrhizobium sp. McL0616]|uniref:sensor histidine kinase n=1 Tax=Bradyrhizobium sp. McL0616 TaxID=3415674 RepID=UPI003CEC0B5F
MNESIHGEWAASDLQDRVSELQDRVAELIEQQTAISEVLRAIASSPHDLQPIFDALLDNATRLCRADIGGLRLFEVGGLRRVAVRGDPLWVSQAVSSIPVLVDEGGFPSRLATSRLPTHIPDLTALERARRADYWTALENIGVRTALTVPLVKDDEIVGIIALLRKQLEPFTDKQMSLCRDFAAQATIALESTRRERQYREMQTALAHANRVATIGQLTASLAHELNQPLTAVAGGGSAALRWLARQTPSIDEARSCVERMINDANRATRIIAGLRDLTKQNAPRVEVVDLNEAIADVIALTYSEAIKSGVTISTRPAPELPPVQGDRVQLQQVMLNLMVNAIQAMSSVEEGARELQIRIETVPSEGGVRIGVRDTGPGLPPESLPCLFEPFYTTKPDGMGMGLSICRSIIEAHGGRLWAIPCEPQGALFQFTIPADRTDHP